MGEDGLLAEMVLPDGSEILPSIIEESEISEFLGYPQQEQTDTETEAYNNDEDNLDSVQDDGSGFSVLKFILLLCGAGFAILFVIGVLIFISKRSKKE